MSSTRFFIWFAGMIIAMSVGDTARAQSALTPVTEVPECERLLSLQVPLRVPSFLTDSNGEPRNEAHASVWEKCRNVLRIVVELDREVEPDPELDEEAADLYEFYLPRLVRVEKESEKIVQTQHQRQILKEWAITDEQAERLRRCEKVDEVVADWFVTDRGDLVARLDAIRTCHQKFISSVPQSYEPSELQPTQVNAGSDPSTWSRAIQFLVLLLAVAFIIYRLRSES